ncbi:MAG: hypothetical protein ACYCU7_18865, partial [Acidimicrobiales bacterium]
QEERLIDVEQLSAAVFAGMQQQAAQGQLPINDAARVLQLLRRGERVEDAIMAAQKEAQQRQATQAPAPQPGQVAAPETQPGLAAPGQGAEQPPPTIPPPAAGQQNFQKLAAALMAAPKPAGMNGPPNG